MQLPYCVFFAFKQIGFLLITHVWFYLAAPRENVQLAEKATFMFTDLTAGINVAVLALLSLTKKSLLDVNMNLIGQKLYHHDLVILTTLHIINVSLF